MVSANYYDHNYVTFFLATYCFPPFFVCGFFGLKKKFFFPNCLPRPRYWMYEDVTWYGWPLGAIVYCCLLVTLHGQDQGYSKVQGSRLKK